MCAACTSCLPATAAAADAAASSAAATNLIVADVITQDVKSAFFFLATPTTLYPFFLPMFSCFTKFPQTFGVERSVAADGQHALLLVVTTRRARLIRMAEMVPLSSLPPAQQRAYQNYMFMASRPRWDVSSAQKPNGGDFLSKVQVYL